MPNQKFIKKRIINKNFLKKNIIKLKGVFSKKKENILDDPLTQFRRRCEIDGERVIPEKHSNQKSLECPNKNRYKYVNKVTGDCYYTYNTDPKFKETVSKLKNDNDKYFYSRVNKQYCSNQKMLEDKIEEIRYNEEKEPRKKLRNANPNSLYNGYYIGKKKCKEGDDDCKEKEEIRESDREMPVNIGVKIRGARTDSVDSKKSSCHKCNYKIKIPNINTKYKGFQKK